MKKLGDSYVRQGNLNLAFIQYGKALTLDPKIMRIHYKNRTPIFGKRADRRSKKEFQEILKTDPSHVLSHEGMGRTYMKLGEWGEAEKSFLKAIQLDSNLWQAHNFLGIIYDRQKQFDAATPNIDCHFNQSKRWRFV